MKFTGTQDAARELGVSTRTLRRWIAAGLMEAPEKVSIGGQQFWSWKATDLRRAQRIQQSQRRGPKPRQ